MQADGVVGRFLRVTAPALRDLNGEICLAFSIEVLGDGRNVALGSVVTASDSVETGMWAAAAVVDGKGVPGSNPLGTKTTILRREFAVRSGVKRAVLHVTGLGQYVAYLNGQRIGEDLLSPGWTNTDKTILYHTRDVTRLVRSGDNAIGLSLASGMYSVYHPGERYTKFEGRFRPLMAIAKLDIEYEDGSITTLVSDTSWRANFGPITYSHVYGGEDYDARLEPDGWTESDCYDGAWPLAAWAPVPEGALKGASFAAPPIRAVETLAAKTIHPLALGVEVYDLGQNAALMPRLSVSGPRGSKVRITPAELVKKDGSVDRASSAHGAKGAYWEYTLSGEGEIERWHPEFFYHGARYLQVERLPAAEGGSRPEVASIDALVTHSSAAPIGDFACSNELLNRTRDLIRWAQRSNLASVITDCPHRERLGWLEQYHLNGPSLRYEFELNRLFMKTFGDMVDAQTTEGLVPDIAPEYIKFEGGFRDSPEWGRALILAAWQQYLWSGDDTVFRRYYANMERYVAYLGSKADKHILSHGLGDWYDLGPGRPGFAQLTPVSVTATATYYEDVLVLRNVARLMGWEHKALQYQDLAGAIKTAFVTELFDEESGSFGRESQTGNAMAYVLDLCPPGEEEAVLNAIIADVKRRGNAFTSGDVGHRYLLMALARGGRSDIIYAMHSERDRPGYGWQLDQGATSLTEAWDANRHAFQNHFMLGHIMEWFYGGLAGIAPDPEAPGFRNVIVKPQLVAGIDWAQASFDSIRGPILVRWERTDAGFGIEVSLAPNMTADVYVPVGDVKKIHIAGKPAKQVEGVREIVSKGGSQLLRLASGNWKIEVR